MELRWLFAFLLLLLTGAWLPLFLPAEVRAPACAFFIVALVGIWSMVVDEMREFVRNTKPTSVDPALVKTLAELGLSAYQQYQRRPAQT